MNVWQLERQIAYRLRNAVWPDSPGQKVFGDVVVSALPPESFLRNKTVPYAVVRRLASDFDREHPERVTAARFEVVVVAQGYTDLAGQSSLIGGSAPGPGQSQNRGVDQILAPVHRTLTAGDSTNGFLMVASGVVEPEALPDSGTFGVSKTSLHFEVYGGTRDLYYHDPYMFLGVAIPTPAAPVLSSDVPGAFPAVTAGAHYVQISYLVGSVEGPLSPASNTVTFGGMADAIVNLSVSPAPAGVTGINVYMTHAGGSTPFQVEAATGESPTLTGVEFGNPDSINTVPFSGGLTVSLSWSLPPDRYDRLGLVLRRASGSVPPATINDGTGVGSSTGALTLVTLCGDSPGAGTWSYSIFGSYDEVNGTPTTAGRWSAPVSLTVTV